MDIIFLQQSSLVEAYRRLQAKNKKSFKHKQYRLQKKKKKKTNKIFIQLHLKKETFPTHVFRLNSEENFRPFGLACA